MKTVLVRESDRECTALLRLAVDDQEWTVETLKRSTDLAQVLETRLPDVVLIDVDQEDGEALVHAAAQAPCTIVAVTSDAKDEQAIALISLGADAVYTKPLAPDLLLARLDAAVRCIHKCDEPSESVYAHGGLAIDLNESAVSVRGEALHLTVTEYRLLRMLALNAGRIVGQDYLLRMVWGEGYEGSHDLLRTFVSNLRRRLVDAGIAGEIIHTTRGVGYWVPRAPTIVETPVTSPSFASERWSNAERTRAQSRQLREELGTRTKVLLHTTQQLRHTLQAIQPEAPKTD